MTTDIMGLVTRHPDTGHVAAFLGMALDNLDAARKSLDAETSIPALCAASKINLACDDLRGLIARLSALSPDLAPALAEISKEHFPAAVAPILLAAE